MPPKSIFRQPGTRHFQVVHRSQRDPLINDPEASQHVLKPISRQGKSRAELEQLLPPSTLAHDQSRANIGEAAQYGVYFDDTDYDYMQHLREVGRAEDGVESILLEAPTLKGKGKGKGKNDGGLVKEATDDSVYPRSLVHDLPSDVLPSRVERSQAEAQDAKADVPAALVGLRPDMDPHLRQTLTALEDDAFVDDALGDDFFAELVADGEHPDFGENEAVEGKVFEFEFLEEGVEEGKRECKDFREGGSGEGEEREEGREESWQDRFARFKLDHAARQREGDVEGAASDDGEGSEGGDTVGKLPELGMKVIGGKKRRSASDASGYSMSSASMYRNEGLTLLDERFDQVEREYNSEDDEDAESTADSDSDSAPDLMTSREDFNALMDDFLENYEVFGGKLRSVLPGETAADKLGTIRQSFGDPHALLALEDDDDGVDAYDEFVEQKADRWDCETILTTYSNLENHPRLIRARQVKSTPKIRLNPKSGLPIVEEEEDTRRKVVEDAEAVREPNKTVARAKNESKEEKQARKQAVKDERKARRADKKSNKELFSNEKKQLMQTHKGAPTKGVRKL